MHYWYQRQKWPIQRNVLAKRFAPPTPESIEDSHCCPQTSPEDVWTNDTHTCHQVLKVCATSSPQAAFASTTNLPQQCGVVTPMPFIRALAHASEEGWLRPPKASPDNAAARHCLPSACRWPGLRLGPRGGWPGSWRHRRCPWDRDRAPRRRWPDGRAPSASGGARGAGLRGRRVVATPAPAGWPAFPRSKLMGWRRRDAPAPPAAAPVAAGCLAPPRPS